MNGYYCDLEICKFNKRGICKPDNLDSCGCPKNNEQSIYEDPSLLKKEKDMKKAFTLMELIVVLVIIGILTVILVNNIKKVRKYGERKGSIWSASNVEDSRASVLSHDLHSGLGGKVEELTLSDGTKCAVYYGYGISCVQKEKIGQQ